jgi:hypothetical protein
MKWPQFSKEPVAGSDKVGNAVEKMIEASLPQAAANYKALQQRQAAEAKRLREEERLQGQWKEK